MATVGGPESGCRWPGEWVWVAVGCVFALSGCCSGHGLPQGIKERGGGG